VPPLAPASYAACLPLAANLNGDGFSEMVTVGSGDGASPSPQTPPTTEYPPTVRRAYCARGGAERARHVGQPVGTAALSGRLIEYANAATVISDRWFQLGDEARRHADDHSGTVSAVPKPQEFKEVEAPSGRGTAQGNGIAASQLLSSVES
jgi:hypothetical protein